MKINTRIFGEIDIEESKILTFDKGIIGFPDLRLFTLIHDEEVGANAGIRYLQSMDEPGFAMPVMDPLIVKPDYDPEVNDELLSGLGNLDGLGELNQENILVLVTVSVPSDLTKMTVNLQGPIVINADERKAAQIIVDSSEYPVKFPVYDILKSRKDGE